VTALAFRGHHIRTVDVAKIGGVAKIVLGHALAFGIRSDELPGLTGTRMGSRTSPPVCENLVVP
jgi:hypothetical protein